VAATSRGVGLVGFPLRPGSASIPHLSSYAEFLIPDYFVCISM
jgi:hypothetical protein